MTIAEYIGSKFRAFGVTEAMLADVALDSGLSTDLQYDRTNANQVGLAMIGLLEELILSPRQKSINENGFSVTWDFDGLGQWYLWLCRKHGRKPDDEVTDSLGISRLTDRTDMW